jgi:serine/threonine protein kinase
VNAVREQCPQIHQSKTDEPTDRILDSPTVSNRHCLIFTERKGGDAIAVLEDLSGNGTFVNDTIVGRNKRRELTEGDEIAILDQARYVFRYPLVRNTHKFRSLYTIQEQLGKGHFASVYLCVEKATGMRSAVKKFEKRTGPGEKSKVDGLQQEIAVLMAVSHPTLLCLKDTFNEDDGVYLVLELATEGELFNWIVMKQKLTEPEARKVFIQLFQAVKYLVGTFPDFSECDSQGTARAQYCAPRHQAREHSPYRQESTCQAGRLWACKDHWRGIIHNHIVRYTVM